MLFLNFCPFLFYKFQMTVVKKLLKKPSVFIMDFEGSYDVVASNIFVLQIFGYKTRAFKNILKLARKCILFFHLF